MSKIRQGLRGDKHSSFLDPFVNNVNKKFYNKIMNGSNKPECLSCQAMLAYDDINHWQRLERFAKDQHSSLLQTFIDFGYKSFTTLGHGVNFIGLVYECVFVTGRPIQPSIMFPGYYPT
jgi:hypothetical protein